MRNKKRIFGWLFGFLSAYLLVEFIRKFGPLAVEKMKDLDWFSVAIGLLIIVVPVLFSHLVYALIVLWKTMYSETQEAPTDEQADLLNEICRRMKQLERSVEREERAFLESRLHVLWGLSEIKKSLDRMDDRGSEGWKGSDPDEEEIQWVQVYAHREIKRIGLRLRELDQERLQNEASPEE